MHRVMGTFVLAVALLPRVDAVAQTSVLTLSCDGVMKNARSTDEEKGERITNMGLVVDLTKRTVSGLGGVVARINRVDDAGVSFSGEADMMLGGRPIGEKMTVTGEIDRVTGAVQAMTLTTAGDWATLEHRSLSRSQTRRIASLRSEPFLATHPGPPQDPQAEAVLPASHMLVFAGGCGLWLG
jgi:hypothetical protein